MSTNHLLIGLGGTGGKILRAFRKTLFQEFRNRPPGDVQLGYLYVDSSPEMMGIDDPSWKILGTSVQLDNTSQLLIREANLVTQLDNINNFPGIRPWIGDRALWKTVLAGLDATRAAGGQKRRLGRFLFACKINEFKQRLKLRVQDLQSAGSVAVTFHVCVGLAGGTGAGSVLDVIAQIRHAYASRGDYRILVYALLPEEHPKPNWDTGNYHANGYAALLDLNAVSAGRLQPHDISGEQERLDVPDPFAGCYLFTNENQNGLAVDVDRDVPAIAADFLYQKIVASSALGWSGLDRIEAGENGDSSPETNPSGNKKERSKKFLAFGIKRLAIPEDEIREFLAYSFTRQAALQLAFNNWSDELGFRDEARNQEFGTVVSERDTLGRWRLSDEHLTLSLPVLPMEVNSPRWKPIHTEWADLLPNFKGVVRGLEDRVWLDELAKMCAQRFDSTYRSDMGVRKFYETKGANRREHAREIRRLVETELLNDWKNGVRSMHEIGLLIAALITSLEDRARTADEKIVRHRDGEEQAGKKVVANAKEYAKIGPLSALFGKRASLLDAQATCLQEQMTLRTRHEAWIFAKGLLQELVTEFTALRGEVNTAASTIAEATKEFDNALAARCGDESGRLDLRQQLVRFYHPERVKEFARGLTRDHALQTGQASQVRGALIEQLGDQPTFGAFNARLPRQRFLDLLERQGERAAVEAHNTLLAANREQAPLLGVNIVEQLAREYSGRDEALKKFITDLVKAAGNYVTFEPTEINKQARGIHNVPTMLRSFTVVLPKTPQSPEFLERLQAAFRGASESQVHFIESDLKRNEITLLSIVNLFPLRFLRPVSVLRDRYDRRLAAGGARARLEVHSDGDGSDLPPLYVASAKALSQEGLPLLLLARGLGLVDFRRGGTGGGGPQLWLLAKDENGFDRDPVALGPNLLEAADRLDEATFENLQEVVTARLAAGAATPADLRAKVLTEVEAFKAERGGDPTDPDLLRLNAAGRAAVTRLTV